MSHAVDRTLLSRSLGGDWQSRIDLYKKYLHSNPRVRRLREGYPNPDDFLHDCFTNILHTGSNFNPDMRLGDFVESVAGWTALEYERISQVEKSSGMIFRMHAAIESDEPENKTSYVPPGSESRGSLHAAIESITGELPYKLLRAAAPDKSTWENVAEAGGKPLNTIGPILAKAIDRLSRFFGAPPPLNPDLEPVFAEVSAEDAAARHADPLKPRGRVVAMQLDPPFYSVTPEMRKIGLSVPAEVRSISLWEAANPSAQLAEPLTNHLSKCTYCSALLSSIKVLRQALLAGNDQDFLLCPGASTLMADEDDFSDELDKHLDDCALCRNERIKGLTGGERGKARSPRAGVARKMIMIATAVLVLAGLAIGGYFYFRKEPAPEPTVASNPAPANPPTADSPASAVPANSSASPDITVFPEFVGARRPPDAQAKKLPNPTGKVVPTAPSAVPVSKYQNLADRINLDDPRVMESVRPEDQVSFMEARNVFRAGKPADAALLAAKIPNDPGAQMLYGACLYMRSLADGYRELKKAEAMPPRNAFRCWITLQAALLAEDPAVAEREAEHLANNTEFGPRAKIKVEAMHAIK